MNYDVNMTGVRKLLADRVIAEINANTVEDNPPRHSWRVKPSSLGGECTAQEWYAWRWVKREIHDGRILRLFKRGHGAEHRFTAMLRRAGWTVEDIDPERAGSKFPQFNVKLFHGHLSAYLDGKGSHPEYTGGQKILLEFKTYNTKRFSALVNGKGLQIEDPKYYGQVVIYMKEHNLPWCLFLAENKNDDDLHVEIIQRDDVTATSLLNKAHTIITSKVRPARIAQSPAFHKCKYCHFNEICHNGAPVEKNCRSCLNCVPTYDGKFHCEKWNGVIPADVIETNQPCHDPVK